MVRRSSGEQAAHFIRRLVFEGELRPGSRVPQDAIAQTLGISRIPLREALIALEREGWVTIRLHRGAFINVLDADAVRDHYELYGLVYGYATRRAMARSAANLVATLRPIAAEIAGTTDPAAMGRLALAFHGAIVSAARSPRIKVVLRAMSSLIPGEFFEEVPAAMDVQRHGISTIMKAMEKGDAPLAAANYAALMSRLGDEVVDVFESRGLLEPVAS